MVSNYRKSILSNLSKTFECLMYPVLYDHVKKFLDNNQYGFMFNKSINTNLVSYITGLAFAVDRGFKIDAIYTDFLKAFDKVNHKLLLFKLHSLGITKSTLFWCSFYLKNRLSSIITNGSQSDPYFATSGVPQGSSLGQLLFNIFTNDILQVFTNSTPYLFAHDLNSYNYEKIRCELTPNWLR